VGRGRLDGGVAEKKREKAWRDVESAESEEGELGSTKKMGRRTNENVFELENVVDVGLESPEESGRRKSGKLDGKGGVERGDESARLTGFKEDMDGREDGKEEEKHERMRGKKKEELKR
jgi:hypothetical protein